MNPLLQMQEMQLKTEMNEGDALDFAIEIKNTGMLGIVEEKTFFVPFASTGKHCSNR